MEVLNLRRSKSLIIVWEGHGSERSLLLMLDKRPVMESGMSLIHSHCITVSLSFSLSLFNSSYHYTSERSGHSFQHLSKPCTLQVLRWPKPLTLIHLTSYTRLSQQSTHKVKNGTSLRRSRRNFPTRAYFPNLFTDSHHRHDRQFHRLDNQ